MAAPPPWLLVAWLLLALAGGGLIWSPLGFGGWTRPHRLDPEDLPSRPRLRMALLAAWALLLIGSALWWFAQAGS